MKNTKAKKYISFVCILFLIILYTQVLFVVPDHFMFFDENEYKCKIKGIIPLSLKSENTEVISIQKSRKYNNSQSSNNVYNITTGNGGSTALDVILFGIIPIKKVNVNVISYREVAACGIAAGIRIETEGILVIGFSEVTTKDGENIQPYSKSGIMKGDFIIKINDKEVNSAKEISSEIQKSKGEDVKITYIRDNQEHKSNITPVISMDDKQYHTGLWVRDSSAGIGTITFFNPYNNKYGALGHGITDVDTGITLPVKSGEVLKSDIDEIKKGINGKPGELKGNFFYDKKVIGDVDKNNSVGVYGRLSEEYTSKYNFPVYPIALKEEIKIGPAKILCNIDGHSIEEYNIKILKISRIGTNLKNMVIKITDEELLSSTGGIVQGMSGSPIIQDNHIIGAVTHVLVNEPSKGYGVFIETMLKEIQ